MIAVTLSTLLEQKFKPAYSCQTKATVTPIILPIKYAHIRVMAVSYVTLCVPCHRTYAHAITYLFVFLWRVTYGAPEK